MSDKEIVFATDVETGRPVSTTIKKIIVNRLLIEGDSGSGKSHDVTTFVEGTDKEAQRIIIDIEGEYFPLKDNFSFLLIGKTNDIIKPNLELNLNDVYIDKLAKKLIEKSADTIIDLSETPNLAQHFVAVFFKALLTYAKLLKRPLLIFLDEAHVFAPEKGTGSEESLKAVIEMAKRGRKRGIGLICATQAMADFSKNVVRQLKIRVIGNCTYDKDVKAACDYLGFGKEREDELKNLAEDHHFFIAATGNAITIGGQRPKKVPKVKFLKNKTKLYDFDFGKSFKINEKDSGAIRDIAAEFSDIPAEINDEFTEKEKLGKENLELRAKNKELTVRLTQAERQQPRPIDPQALQQAEQRGYQKGIKEAESKFALFQTGLKRLYATHKPIYKRIAELSAELGKVEQIIPEIDHFLNTPLSLKLPPLPIETKLPGIVTSSTESKSMSFAETIPTTPMVNTTSVHQNSDATALGLGQCERQLLIALVQLNGKATKRKLSILTCYSNSSGGFNNAISKLKTTECAIVSGNELTITDLGRKAVQGLEPINDTPEAILQRWVQKLEKCPGAILECLNKNPHTYHTKSGIADDTGYSETSGGFNNGISRLNSLELVNKNSNGMFRLAEEFLY